MESPSPVGSSVPLLQCLAVPDLAAVCQLHQSALMATERVWEYIGVVEWRSDQGPPLVSTPVPTSAECSGVFRSVTAMLAKQRASVIYGLHMGKSRSFLCCTHARWQSRNRFEKLHAKKLRAQMPFCNVTWYSFKGQGNGMAWLLCDVSVHRILACITRPCM